MKRIGHDTEIWKFGSNIKKKGHNIEKEQFFVPPTNSVFLVSFSSISSRFPQLFKELLTVKPLRWSWSFHLCIWSRRVAELDGMFWDGRIGLDGVECLESK